MAWHIHQIKTYKVYEVSANSPGYENTSAFISLYWNNEHHARLWFTIGDTPPTLPNGIVSMGSPPFYYVRFRGTQFQSVIDLLRNEKPVFLHWNDSSKGAFIATNKEPVGEEET